MFQTARRLVVAACVSSTALTAACSYSAPTAPPREASANLSGSPYTYYLIQTSLPNAPFAELAHSAQIAVEEVNSNGGINGRPLRLKTCRVNLDLNKAASCAREAAADKSVIAANIFLGQAETVLQTWTKAGLPVVSDFPVSLAHYSCPVCFPTSAGAFATAAGAGMLAATQLRAQRVSYVALDVPASRGLGPLTSQLLQASGQSTRIVKTVPVPLTAGDLSAQVTAASRDADAMLVLLTVDLLPRFLRTAQQLGVRIPIVTVPVDRKVIAQTGAPIEGTYHVDVYSHESAGFREYADRLAARYPNDPAADNGYAIWMGVRMVQQVSKGQPEVTRQSLLTALNKLTNVDTGGATPPLDFTKRFAGFGGKIPRLFNNTIVFCQVKGAKVVELSGFQQFIPTA
jgi:branched-chain amino acid transport system substrate-binding protein